MNKSTTIELLAKYGLVYNPNYESQYTKIIEAPDSKSNNDDADNNIAIYAEITGSTLIIEILGDTGTIMIRKSFDLPMRTLCDSDISSIMYFVECLKTTKVTLP